MADGDLIRDTTTLIVCARTPAELEDALRQYGDSPANPRYRPLYDGEWYDVLDGLPSTTPWCATYEVSGFQRNFLEWKFGKPITIAEGINLKNNANALVERRKNRNAP